MRVCALITFVFGLLTVDAAFADTRSPKFGAWEFASFTAPSGNFYCSILSAVKNRNVGQNIVIKGSPSASYLVIDLYKDKWNHRRGSTVQVMFDFANNRPLALPAYADAHILDIRLPVEVTASFLLELTEQPLLQVIFPDDDSDTWAISAGGAKEAVKEMTSCLIKAKQRGAAGNPQKIGENTPTKIDGTSKNNSTTTKTPTSNVPLPVIKNTPDTLCAPRKQCTDGEFLEVVSTLRRQWAITPDWLRAICSKYSTYPSIERCILNETSRWLASHPGARAQWVNPDNFAKR